jgi:mevalonate kinase
MKTGSLHRSIHSTRVGPRGSEGRDRIVVSAPGKLMLFGEHAVVYGRACIVTAVDQRIRVWAERTAASELLVEAPDVGVAGYKKSICRLGDGDVPKAVRFIEFAVKNVKRKFGIKSGIKIKTKSDFSSKFGFGSSSAVTVGVVKAASELFDLKLTNKDIFDLCYKTVLEVQEVGSGFDLAAAIWGGTLYFVGGGKKVVQISKRSLPLVVGYTGIKADTATLVKKVAELRKKEHKIIEPIFELMALIVEDARKSLEKGDYRKLGELANLNQGLLDSLGVSTRKLSDLIFAARHAGAYGAKLSGAGGGDCMIAFTNHERKNKVESAIRSMGEIVLTVKTGVKGVRIEK